MLTEILGPRGQPGVDTLTIIRASNIPDVFDDETLDDVRQQARANRYIVRSELERLSFGRASGPVGSGPW